MHHRIPHMLTPEELRLIHPRRRLRPYVAASPYTVAEATGGSSDCDGNIVPCATYLWGALLRIDVVESGPESHLVFFGTGAMQVWACNLLEEDDVLALDEYAAGWWISIFFLWMSLYPLQYDWEHRVCGGLSVSA
jgi:hypothetical protein